jgi:hypothetical protein
MSVEDNIEPTEPKRVLKATEILGEILAESGSRTDVIKRRGNAPTIETDFGPVK